MSSELHPPPSFPFIISPHLSSLRTTTPTMINQSTLFHFLKPRGEVLTIESLTRSSAMNRVTIASVSS
jgi:hypothetical protein